MFTKICSFRPALSNGRSSSVEPFWLDEPCPTTGTPHITNGSQSRLIKNTLPKQLEKSNLDQLILCPSGMLKMQKNNIVIYFVWKPKGRLLLYSRILWNSRMVINQYIIYIIRECLWLMKSWKLKESSMFNSKVTVSHWKNWKYDGSLFNF